MKPSLKNIFLTFFVLVVILYSYSFINDIVIVKFITKPILNIMLGFYCIAVFNPLNRLYLLALFFDGLGDMLFVLNTKSAFILVMGVFLFYMLTNMLVLTEKIGEIRMTTFFKLIIPFFIILVLVITLIFEKVGVLKLFFTIYGIVISLYAGFALYFYVRERHKYSLFNLIGVLFFIGASVIFGLYKMEGVDIFWKILNAIFYTGSLLLIYVGYMFEEKKVSTS